MDTNQSQPNPNTSNVEKNKPTFKGMVTTDNTTKKKIEPL